MAKQKGLPLGDGNVVRLVTTPPELIDAYAFNGADTGSRNDEPSLTRQEFAEECDINVIMKQYEKTGVISHVASREPLYLDLTDMPDFRSAMDMMASAEKAFMSLPANVRRDFDNDARNFVDFAQDRANLDKMREYGLAPPAEKPEPPKAAPASPEPSKGEDGAP